MLVYDAVTCGRSEMDPSKRMYVRSKDWLPNDVEAFYQVSPWPALHRRRPLQMLRCVRSPLSAAVPAQEVVSKRQPESGGKLPCFLGGQSMGGLVSVMCGILHPEHWQARARRCLPGQQPGRVCRHSLQSLHACLLGIESA